MAGALVGSALLSAFLQVAFDRLASREIVDYFRGRKLNEKLLKRLNIMLISINAVVDDAEEKQIRNTYVKAWLDEVKDAVFEAEDMLDEIDTQVSKCKLEAESETTNSSKVWNFLSASIGSFDKEIESKMKQVLDNLEYLASKKDMLGLKEASGSGFGSGRKVSQKLPTTSLVDETVIYGRDVDKEIIIKWLISHTKNGNQLSIISIVGMGGMGKTTVAQLLYNDPRMVGEFDIKAWVCVSEEFDVFKITRTILEAITRSADDSKDINMLQVKLKEKLIGKRFLIVLDDVWNENYMQWEALQTPFNYGAQGSKIIVTTRCNKVASTMRSDEIHQLKHLQEEYCWLLFAKHAFHDEDPYLSPEIKEVSAKMIEKCKGLPLALKTIGSLLYTKSSFQEWKSIFASEIWDLSDEDSNVIPALRLSYHYLPSYLKRCFAYCSLFPKGYEFDKEHLILLWMAENFLQCPQQNKDLEEVGEQYFNDLLSRSFFQPSSGDKMCFVMHDLLNDLAKYVSGDFCFRLEVEEAQNISKTTRHFSYLRNKNEASKRFEALYKANRLRTFLPLSRHPNDERLLHWMSSKLIHDMFSHFKCMRVLSLAVYSNVIELPDSIGNLKHLRYLDLSGNAVKKLPDSTCLLYNLQVLKLKNCQSLEELPLNLHKLTNLRHLDLRETKVRKMPMHLGRLKNLQVLTSFCVGKGSEFNIQQLRELNLHGTLSILELQNIVNPLDALAVNLKNKLHLVNLHLEWSVNHDDPQKQRDVLEKLQPSKILKELSIKNYCGTKFPDWLGDNSLSNMVSLELSNCKHCVLLPPLGLLPSLKKLLIIGLDGIVVIGAELHGVGSSAISFASLESLTFTEMRGWEEWECKAVIGAFPRLQELCIVNCPKLKERLPKQLPSLMKLDISSCQQLVASVPCAPKIEELSLDKCGKVHFDYHPSTLKMLKIGGHNMEASLLERIGNTISDTWLECLKIYDCPNMKIPLHHCYNFLVRLYITSSCDSLRTFPLYLFPKLDRLFLRKCVNLEMLCVPEEHGSLTMLRIWECPKFVSFPSGGFSAPRLWWCEIEKLENLKSLPECMHILFPSLRDLRIKDCPQLESFCDGGLPSNLQYLYLCNCSKLISSLKRALETNTSLVALYIEEVDVESFPDQGLLPASLTYLFIHRCPDLKKLDYKGLCHLSFLSGLYLADCPRLQCLPDEGLPKSISNLVIKGNCLLLKQHCRKPRGADWGRIAHIQCIRIDDEMIT